MAATKILREIKWMKCGPWSATNAFERLLHCCGHHAFCHHATLALNLKWNHPFPSRIVHALASLTVQQDNYLITNLILHKFWANWLAWRWTFFGSQFLAQPLSLKGRPAVASLPRNAKTCVINQVEIFLITHFILRFPTNYITWVINYPNKMY